MSRLLSVLLVLLFILSACSRKGPLTFFRKETLQVVNPEFDFLTAKAKFKFEHQEKGLSATANFRIQKDSVIWISITPGMGIEAARVLIEQESIQVLDKLNKQYYTYTFAQLRDQYDFDFNFQMLQSVILGNLVEPYESQPLEKTPDFFTYNSEFGPYKFVNSIGTKTMKLEELRVTEDSTATEVLVTYKDFALVDTEIFPQLIHASVDYNDATKTATKIDISYNKIELKEGKVSFPFSVPGRYGRK
ncbi:MAG: DUF4292 domain-containing protein [Bacteroidota bacterium]